MKAHAVAIVSLVAIALWGCRASSGKEEAAAHATKTPAAEVLHPKQESQLTTVILSDSAKEHLEIRTIAVRREKLPNHKTYGGEFVVPEGRSILMSAPLAGTVVSDERGAFPTPGMDVEKGQALMRLVPSIRGGSEVLNPSDRIALARARADLEAARVQAAGEFDAATVRLEGTRIALERAETLVKQNAGSVRSLDEARAAYQLAQAAVEAANARKHVLDETMSFLSGASDAATLTIAAPFAGVVRRLHVAPDEVIAGGAQLCEVVALDPLWVRVPVYVGDLRALSTDRPARGIEFGNVGGASIPLTPVAAPSTATAATSTVDLYYRLDNVAGAHQPGERCIVDIPVAGESESLVIPRQAVVYDIHGDAWCYVAGGDGAFVRRRVAVRRISGDDAVIESGVGEGDLVVTDGVAELFGMEFGTAGH